MKYNFVYDTDVIAKDSIYLSEDEINIIFATIVGKHNAIFYGYKPERLVEAIKKLTSDYPFVEISNLFSIEEKLHEACGGILYTKDFDSWGIVNQQYLYLFSINDSHRDSQFIATTVHNPTETVVPDMINNFDIIYMCKEVDKLPYSRASLADSLDRVFNFHNSLHSGRFVTSTELALDNSWLYGDAYLHLCKLRAKNPVVGRKVIAISRSVSDCKSHVFTMLEDIFTAESMCGLHREWF